MPTNPQQTIIFVIYETHIMCWVKTKNQHWFPINYSQIVSHQPHMTCYCQYTCYHHLLRNANDVGDARWLRVESAHAPFKMTRWRWQAPIILLSIRLFATLPFFFHSPSAFPTLFFFCIHKRMKRFMRNISDITLLPLNYVWALYSISHSLPLAHTHCSTIRLFDIFYPVFRLFAFCKRVIWLYVYVRW